MDEIEKLEETIKNTRKYIKKLEDKIQEAGDDGIRVADYTKDSLKQKKRLIDLEQKLQDLQLKEIEEMIRALYEKKEIDEKEYTDKNSDIFRYTEASKAYREWQETELDIGLAKFSGFIKEPEISGLREQSRRQVEIFNSKMQNFKEHFTKRQVREGKLDEQQRQEILAQSHYGQEDIEEAYNDLVDDMKDVNQEKKTTLDKIKEEYQKYDVRDVVAITDKKTKEQLCALYGIKNSEEVEIYATRTYNETTWKDSWLGEKLRKR